MCICVIYILVIHVSLSLLEKKYEVKLGIVNKINERVIDKRTSQRQRNTPVVKV